MSVIIFYDFETTGLNPFYDQIIEIGAHNYTTSETFNELCNIGDLILPYKITQITGLTSNDLKHEKIQSEENVLKSFCHFIQKASEYNTKQVYLVAHNNNGFDRLFLKKRTSVYNIRLPNRWKYIDSMLMAKFIYPSLRSYSLSYICKYLDVTQTNAHRAYDDVECLKKVFEHMMLLFDKNIEYIWKTTNLIES